MPVQGQRWIRAQRARRTPLLVLLWLRRYPEARAEADVD